MEKKNGIANEMQLFHGTKKIEPSLIYNGEEGFDVRFANSGMWGFGCYFAQDAIYSNRSYSHKLDSRRQFFLVDVLVGESTTLEQQEDDLKFPPEKNSDDEVRKCSNSLNFEVERYDSINATPIANSPERIYVVYNNGRAYPRYLITYKVPKDKSKK